MEEIKVLHYIRNLDLGGTTKTCQLFFEYASKDFEVTLVHEKTGDHTRRDQIIGCGKIIEIDSYIDPSNPDPSVLQGIINTLGTDILHVYRSGFPEFPVGFVQVPHVVETNVFGQLEQNRTIDKSLFMSKWLMNHTLGSYAAKWFKPNRFDFINNPVEEPYTNESLNLSSDAIWLGRCGRPDNGIYNAVSVNAARLLRLQGYDVRFVVMAAPQNMINDLIEMEIPFKAIEPTVDPLILSTFYNSVDIYAHARADGETFGVNIAEAMMHGKPVVTHIATPSYPGMGVFQSQTELVDDGKTGYVVSNDASEYAAALKLLIDNSKLRLQMGKAGRAKAKAEYYVNVCVNKLERIYKEVYND